MTAAAAFMFRKTIALAIVLSGIILCLGIFRPGVVVAPIDNSGLTVAVIQSEACALYSYIDLTKTIADKSPDLIIWPECALPYDVRKKPHRFEELMKFSADMNSIFVIGTQTQLENIDEDWYNTALTLDRNGVIGEYYKNRPVHLFNDGTAGTNLNPIVTEIGNFATPICFDCDYSTVSRKMTKLGAEFFAVPSFDSYFWGKTQHLQHCMFFRLRAAENSRWLACAASSGVSQIIDPHGNVHKCIPALETGAITGRIGKENHLNFYVRIGWLFPWITIGCSAIFLLWSLKNKSFNCISKRQP
jgi:apolipoprotein N-acyltransferase